jgi:signal transduction histidine kinase
MQRAVDHLRGYVTELQGAPTAPPVPDLGAELVALAADVERAAGARVVLALAPRAVAALSPAQARELAFAAREAASNAVRHGRARTIRLGLRARGGRAVLSIEDDGVGFRPGALLAGHGLRNIAARAERLGGALAITRSGRRGTILRLSVPLV